MGFERQYEIFRLKWGVTTRKIEAPDGQCLYQKKDYRDGNEEVKMYISTPV